jgi:chemotaxis protein CheD
MSIFLLPGEVCISKEPRVVTTVLGSCISVTMFAAKLGAGAICHARLPHGRKDDELAYVNNAVTYMVETMEAMGIKRGELEVKLFGGADVLKRVSGSGKSIGRQNVETAIEVIGELRLRLSAQAVGGFAGRKIRFWTSTGQVLCTSIGLE